jgi:hypothetical protein
LMLVVVLVVVVVVASGIDRYDNNKMYFNLICLFLLTLIRHHRQRSLPIPHCKPPSQVGVPL